MTGLVVVAAIAVIVIIVVIGRMTSSKLPVAAQFTSSPNSMSLLYRRNAREMREVGTDIITVTAFGVRHVVLNSWQAARAALSSQALVFSGRPRFRVLQDLTQKNDIVSIDGAVWRLKRRMIVRQLRDAGFGRSTTTEDRLVTEIERFADVLRLRTTNGGATVEVKSLFFLPILNVIYGLIAGTTYDYDDERIVRLGTLIRTSHHLLCRITTVMHFPFLKLLPGDIFGHAQLTRNMCEIHDFLEAEIERHVRRRTEPETTDGTEPSRDFIDMYLDEINRKCADDETFTNDENNPYQKKHLLGTVVDLIMAAIDTTSATLEWALLYLALWPEIQRKFQFEMDQVIGRFRMPTFADVTSLPYVEATVLEVQRFSTILPLAIPHRTMASTWLGGHHVTADTLVIPNIWAVHFDPKLWGDPERFRPERFLKSDGTVHRPDYFVPFSLGARGCPGTALARMMLFLFLSSLLHRFTFRLPTGHPLPSLEPNTFESLVSTPKPFKVTVKVRDDLCS